MAQRYFVGAIKVWEDDMSTIAFVKKGESTSHSTKHIAVRYFFIIEKNDEREIGLRYRCLLTCTISHYKESSL